MGEQEKKVILLNSEGCGSGDSDLGFEILVNLLDALIKREDRPSAIICWNTAVKLLTEGSPLLSRLRELEGKGVSIFAGKLCVADLGLLDKIAVGKVATMDEILDLILHSSVVSL
jgi:hypothetical protein